MTDPHPPNPSLHERLHDLARSRPRTHAARELEGRSITWGGLAQRATALAARLQGLGVGPEIRVGVCVERSLDLVVALLAVLEAGGTFVPLEPDLPALRLAWIVEDAGIELVLEHEITRGRVPAAMCLRIDRSMAPGPTAPTPVPTPASTPETAAYLIYTSGSTGQPKGVVVEHRSVAALAQALPTRFHASRASKLLQYSSIAFDVSFFDIALWLGSGGVLVLAPAARLLPGPALHQVLADGRITHLTCTPTALSALSEQGLPALQQLMIGGEPLPPDLVRRFGPGRRLWNVYGPTEATVAATAFLTDGVEDWAPIGTPIGAGLVQVVDAVDQPVPTGTSGQILLGGPGVARGYHGRPELTRDRFLQSDHGRLYRTGDRGYLRADGQLVFEGRVDGQVKVRGVRIEPSEIEVVVRSHAGVHEAVVVVRTDHGPGRLVAYVVPTPGHPPSPEAWRSFLTERLPAALVPSAFVVLDALPLLPSSKVDRAALPAPSGARPDLQQAYVAPTKDLEVRVAALFAEILTVSPVGMEDDFFALGGDSLLAVHLLGALTDRLNSTVPAATFFEHPTVRAVSEALVTTPTAPRVDTAVLSSAQLRSWFQHQLAPDAVDGQLPAVLHLRGQIEAPRLRSAVAEVVARHPSLRLILPTKAGQPDPRVLSPDDPRLQLPQVEELAANDLDALVRSEHAKPFRIEDDVAWRVRICRLAPQHHALVFTFHHLIVDAASLGVLVRDLAAVLDGDAPPARSPFPWAARERQALQSGALSPSLSWWCHTLADAPSRSGLPPDRTPREGPRSAALETFELTASAVRAVRAVGLEHGATLYHTLLVALGDALRGCGTGDDALVGTPVAAMDPLARDVFGFFANTVAVRLRGRGSLKTRLARARRAALDAVAHADAPFDQVVAAVDPARVAGQTPLFQVVLAVQQPAPRATTRDGLDLQLTHLVAEVAPFELTLELWPDDGGFVGHALYDTRLYDASTIQAFVHAFVSAVGDLARPREVRPPAQVRGSALPPVDLQGGLAQALARTAHHHAEHGLQVVEADGSTSRWTYTALDREARAFALGLLDRVQPGTPVVLQQARLWDQIRAFWGCLYAGVVPIVLPVPQTWEPEEGRVHKLRSVATRLQAVVLVSAGLRASVEAVVDGSVQVVSPRSGALEPAWAGPEETAFLQASSGSTGAVKLIPETQGAVLQHVASASAHSGYGPEDRTLSWLPLDHVAGLLMCHVKDVVLGAEQVLLPTEHVLANPLVLFDWIERERISHWLAPDFAYTLLLEALQRTPERSWDLSSLQRIANGAETVRPRVTRAFLEGTAHFGLNPRTMQPGFGMAETASVVTFDNDFDLERSVLHVQRHSLEEDLGFTDAPGPDIASFVCLGGPLPGVELRIVDDLQQVCPEGTVGRLWVRGGTVFAGYHDREEGPDAEGWFDTGDLGFLQNARLFLVGRAKDTLVVAGSKVHAEEVEACVATLPGVAARGVAACAVPLADAEGLAVFVVPRSGRSSDLISTVREAVSRRLGIAATHVVLVRAEDLPRTPAGKLRRKELAQRFLAGEFQVGVPALSAWQRTWRVQPGGHAAYRGPVRFSGPGALREALEQATGDAGSAETGPRVWVPPLEPETALSALAEQATGSGVLLVVGGRDAVTDAALAGAIACLTLEQPALDVRLVRCPEAPPDAAAALCRELAAPTGAREVCWHQGVRRVPGVAAVDLAPPTRPWSGQCWMITGGFGGIGQRLAQHLDGLGVRLLLVGRHLPEILPSGPRTAVLDVVDEEALGEAVASAEAAWGQSLDGVFHLAAVLEEGRIDTHAEAAVRRALHARLDGTRALAHLLEDRPRAALVAFGSTAGHTGAAGMGLYAAGSRAQEALIEGLRASGRDARVLLWPGWTAVGLATGRDIGVGIDPGQALQGLGAVLANGGSLQLGPAPSAAPATASEAALRAQITNIWRDALNLEHVDPDASFFALGGHSILLVQVAARLEAALGRPVPVVQMFRHATVSALAGWLAGGERETAPVASSTEAEPIAVVGMAGRFPGADDVEGLWQQLLQARSGARRFSQEELAATGVPEIERLDPRYVPVRAVLDEVAGFDAAFFGMTPAEAALTDPQHRLFLESAWQALEAAGIDSARWTGEIGVFAASGLEGYLLHHVAPSQGPGLARLGGIVGNDKDHIAPRVAFKLDLRGPAVTVQTACSSSLVAVHQACRELLAGGCDVAIAGGANVGFPLNEGHLHQEGHIVSPDGECRAFDAAAAGTFGGDGSGAVVLMRASTARAGGHTVHAWITGSAVNNDGGQKAGYTAPGVEGQVRVVRKALAAAALEASEVGYIEAHGTGTALGDPIEVAALGEALGPRERGQVRYLGALKPNLGHLNAAAGIAALIKALRVVESGTVPPVRHFETPNPLLDLEAASLVPPTSPTAWEDQPRRAGVSAFGFGGTNAHVVLEQAPEPAPADPNAGPVLLTLSAKTETALITAAQRLATHLQAHPELPLAHVAFTLQAGRRAFAHRAAYVARRAEDALAALRSPASVTGIAACRSAVFLFPGQGAQVPGMLRSLYDTEPVVRHTLDTGAELLQPVLGLDLRTLLRAAHDDTEAATVLARTQVTQPALVLTEIALARLWRARGVHATAVAGHSVGEWAAAVIAGILDLEEALTLVARRGAACARTVPGAMLSVALPVEALTLPKGLTVAAENTPDATVVAGGVSAIEAWCETLTRDGVRWRRLGADHAFHTRDMEPVEADLREALQGVELRAPQIPMVSGQTGTWLTPAQATDPLHWAAQVRAPVRFVSVLDRCLADPDTLLIEVGPRRTLSHFVTRRAGGPGRALPTLPSPEIDDADAFVEALGKAWVSGVSLDPARGDRLRVALPSYPFERQRHWIDAQLQTPSVGLQRQIRVDVSGVHAPLPALAVLGGSPALTKLLEAQGTRVQTVSEVDADALSAWLEVLRAQDDAPHTFLLVEPGPAEVLALLRALARRLFRARLRLIAVLSPGQETTAALLGSAPGTVPGLQVRVLEVEARETHGWIGSIAGPAGRFFVGPRGVQTLGTEPAAPEPKVDGARLVIEGPRGDGLAAAEALVSAGVPVALLPWTGEGPGLDKVERAFGEGLQVRTVHDHAGLRPAFDGWCTAQVLEFLERMGLELAPGARFSRAELTAAIQLQPAFDRLLDALLGMAVEDGFLTLQDGTITVTAQEREDAGTLEESLRVRFPRFTGLLDLVNHCVQHYPDALSGRIDAIGVLYPAGGGNLVDAFDRRTVEHRQDRRQILLLAHALRQLAQERAQPGQPFRILELGGGQGLLTWPLIAALADLPIEFHFTDLGALFVEDARREARLRGVEDRMRFDKLDISAPADPSRFPPGSYDAIVAYNVVHAAPDVPAVLRQLKPLLAPGGQLAVVEVVRTERWDVLSWGLAEGWWYFEDDVRTDSPLLHLNTWEELLTREGYQDAAVWPQAPEARDLADHGLLLARAPGVPRGPTRVSRRAALARQPLVHLLHDRRDPLSEAEQALGPVAAVVLDAPVAGIPPLLASSDADWDAQQQACLDLLHGQLSTAQARPVTVLTRTLDPLSAGVEARIEAEAVAAGHTALRLDARNGSGWAPALTGLPTGLVLLPTESHAQPVETAPRAAPPPSTQRTPRNALEATVAAVAAEVLGLPDIGLDDDFVELGADSLIMLRLTDRLSSELGRDVPSEVTFRGSSVASLAQALDVEAPPPPEGSPLIPLQTQGQKSPLFFVHPATGVVFPYFGLARELGTDRPFYALQARGLDGLAPHDTRVEDMARHYITAIRAFQPHGPYHLGGFSFGCYVAYEMAVQLARAGEPPGAVLLVDEPAPIDGYRPSPWLMVGLAAQGAREALTSFLPEYFTLLKDELEPSKPGSTRIRRRDRMLAPLERFVARSTLHAFIPEEHRELAMRQPAMLRLFELFVLHSRLCLTYRPGAYPHSLNLLKATDLRGKAARDPTQGWRMLAAGGVNVHRMPGEHLTMLRDPHVRVVAETIRRCLEEAETD